MNPPQLRDASFGNGFVTVALRLKWQQFRNSLRFRGSLNDNFGRSFNVWAILIGDGPVRILSSFHQASCPNLLPFSFPAHAASSSSKRLVLDSALAHLLHEDPRSSHQHQIKRATALYQILPASSCRSVRRCCLPRCAVPSSHTPIVIQSYHAELMAAHAPNVRKIVIVFTSRRICQLVLLSP